MKLLEILNGLTSSELIKLEKELKDGRRKELYLLFRELRRCVQKDITFDRAIVFYKLYGTKHSHENDSKLRNEVRRLKSIIYQYLVEAELNLEITNDENLFNQQLVKALARRNIKEQYHAEHIKSLKRATDTMDYNSMLELIRTRINFLFKRLHTSDRFHQELEQLIELGIEAAKKRAIIDIRNLETNEVAQNITKNVIAGIKEINFEIRKTDSINFSEVEDQWTLYKAEHRDSLTRVINDYNGLLVSLQRMTQLLDELPAKTTEQQEQYIWCKDLELTALTYTLEFEQVLLKGNHLGDYVKEHKHEYLEHYYNSMILSNLCLRNEGAAIDFYEEHSEAMLNPKALIFSKGINVAYGMFSLGRNDEGMTFIRQLQKEGNAPSTPSEDGLIRCAIIISYIIDNQYEHAMRELDNFRNSKLINMAPDPPRVIEMINIYRRYIRIKQNPQPANRGEYQKLANTIEEMDPRLIVTSPTYRWIKWRLDDELSKKQES